VTTAPTSRQHAPESRYVVLDDEDRITYVSRGLQDELGRWLGHVLWDHLPEAKEIYGPVFDEARASGQEVERVVFYSGRAKRLTAVPAADGLAVHVERLATLDVTTLGTLAESLEAIAEALGARESERSDSRAPGSLRALP
jgi:hypothetical protein